MAPPENLFVPSGRMGLEAQADVPSSSHVLISRAPHPPITPASDSGITQAESIELPELMSKQNDAAAAAPAGEDTRPGNVSEVDVRAQRKKVNIHFFTMCCSMFLLGWNDGTTGPLLPRIQEVYHVRTFRCAFNFSVSLTLSKGKLHNCIASIHLQLLREWSPVRLAAHRLTAFRVSSSGLSGTWPSQSVLDSVG